jgi:hypothetical protein
MLSYKQAIRSVLQYDTVFPSVVFAASCMSFTVTVKEVFGKCQLENIMDFTKGNILGMVFVIKEDLKFVSMELLKIAGIAYCERMHAVLMKSLKIN